jgi:hypothetical protein
VRVGRPFEGLTGEPDLIAMRELVSAATAPLTLSDPTYAERTVTLATVLPQLAPALVREDGRILLGLQLVASFAPDDDLAGLVDPEPPTRDWESLTVNESGHGAGLMTLRTVGRC